MLQILAQPPSQVAFWRQDCALFNMVRLITSTSLTHRIQLLLEARHWGLSRRALPLWTSSARGDILFGRRALNFVSDVDLSAVVGLLV